MIWNAKQKVKRATVEATIIRANGAREALGVIARSRRSLRVWLLATLGVLAVAVLLPALAGWAALGLGAALVVNTGRAIVTDCLVGGSGSEPKYLAWGTGAGTAGATDTTLFTETSEETRQICTTSQQTTTTASDTYRAVGTQTVATSGKTITNVGLFDASSSGNLFFKADFTGLALSVGDAIQFTINVQFT